MKKKEVRKIYDNYQKATDILAMEKVSKLYKLATTDPKTGLYNSTFFANELNHEISIALRYGSPISLILIDIDDFKKINEKYGYLRADKMLIEISDIIKDNLRKTDFAARFGGEEFVLLLPETTQKKAKEVAERLRSQVQKDKLLLKYKVTISIGVSSIEKKLKKRKAYEKVVKIPKQVIQRSDVFSYLRAIQIPEMPEKNGTTETSEDLFKKANLALKYAKTHGKNRVIVYNERLLKVCTI